MICLCGCCTLLRAGTTAPHSARNGNGDVADGLHSHLVASVSLHVSDTPRTGGFTGVALCVWYCICVYGLCICFPQWCYGHTLWTWIDVRFARVMTLSPNWYFRSIFTYRLFAFWVRDVSRSSFICDPLIIGQRMNR